MICLHNSDYVKLLCISVFVCIVVRIRAVGAADDQALSSRTTGLQVRQRGPRLSAYSARGMSRNEMEDKMRNAVALLMAESPILVSLSAIARAFVQVFTSSSAGSVRRKAFP